MYCIGQVYCKLCPFLLLFKSQLIKFSEYDYIDQKKENTIQFLSSFHDNVCEIFGYFLLFFLKEASQKQYYQPIFHLIFFWKKNAVDLNRSSVLTLLQQCNSVIRCFCAEVANWGHNRKVSIYKSISLGLQYIVGGGTVYPKSDFRAHGISRKKGNGYVLATGHR